MSKKINKCLILKMNKRMQDYESNIYNGCKVIAIIDYTKLTSIQRVRLFCKLQTSKLYLILANYNDIKKFNLLSEKYWDNHKLKEIGRDKIK